MSYTVSLVGYVVESVVPYGDKLLGNEKSVNEKDLINRRNVAKSMKKAIHKGDLSESYLRPVEDMERNVTQKIVKNARESSRYVYDQISKLAPALNIFIPGFGACANAVAHAGNAKSLCEFAANAATLQSAVSEVAKYAIPAVGSALIVPIITPLATTAVIGTGVATVLGTTLAADAFNYLRQK